MKELRIIKNSRTHIVINGKRYEPFMLHHGIDAKLHWKLFIDALKLTLLGIRKGEKYSIESCIMYYFQPKYR